MATRTIRLISLLSIFLPLLLLLGCSKTAQIIWRPNQQTMSQVASGSSLLNEPVDRALLAEMATSVLLETAPELVFSPLEPIGEDLPLHPQKGPFFFKNETVFVAIAQDTARVWFFMEQLEEHLANKKIYFSKLPDEQTGGTLSISAQPTLVNYRYRNTLETSTVSLPEKIKLTPEKVAETLAQFSQWEGVQLDTQLNKLTFFGSDVVDNPQISVSDLVTAYKAIFVHEAAGEALFVDMDFGDADKDYKVTFGGGFEDTRPGKVLLEADLLLKALSSGIDPWTQVNPLMQDWCASRRRNAFQRLFCEHIRDYAFNRNNKARRTAETAINDIIDKFPKVAKIVTLSKMGGAVRCIDCIFEAGPLAQLQIKSDIIYKKKFCFETTYEGTYYCEYPGDPQKALEWAEGIFSLTEREKNIVRKSKRFENPEDRILYALLAYGSTQTSNFLDSQPTKKLENVFQTFRTIAPDLTKIIFMFGFMDIFKSEMDFLVLKEELKNSGELASVLSLLSFMSENSVFANEFMSMNKNDQLTLAFITAQALVNSEFAEYISKLQYYHPLCCESCPKYTEVKDMESAFTRFICAHLSDEERIYLAQLIRENGFPQYKTAAEMKSNLRLGNHDEEIQTTRYWFYPGNEVLVVDSSLSTFLFNRPNMVAQAERLNTRKGPYEAAKYNKKIPGVQENLDLVNANYDNLSVMFPTLKDLNNLVRMLSFFRWIRDYHAHQFDLTAYAQTPDYGTPTPRKYPVYETIIATPNGGLLRAVGGVDLHSNTQVGLDQERIDAFLAAKNSSNGKRSFSFENKKFKSSDEFKATGNDAAKNIQVFQNQQNRLEISQQDDLIACHFSENGKLQWSLANLVHPLGNMMTVSADYKNLQWHREFRDVRSTVEQWKINWGVSTLTASQLSTDPLTNNESVRHKKIETQFAEWLNMGLPFEATWQLLSMQFDTVRLVWQNGAYLFSYWFNAQEKHLLAREEPAGDWQVQPADVEQANQLLALPTPTVSAKNKNTHILGIRLLSTIPVDNLVVSEVGYKDDAPVQVHLFEKKPLKYDITEWMKLISSKGAQPFVGEKGSVFFFQPLVKEKKKGGYETFQLTNRPFLVETVANLNATHAGSGKRFGLLDTPSPGELPVNVEEVWKSPHGRKFFFDLEGFSEPYRRELKAIHASSPDNTIVLEQRQDMKPASSSTPDSPEEVIWITGLSEKEAMKRLELASSKGWLKNTGRLRLFNVNNPVYSLGKNLFIENENLRIVGAWQRIIDFETLIALLEEMVPAKSPQELDGEIAAHVASIKRKYKSALSPQKLRIMRSFEDFAFFWEETCTIRQAGASSWKIIEQNAAR